MIGAFRSGTVFSLGVRLLAAHRWFSCFFIVGIHASGISAPLSLLMLFGLSLMSIASFTFLVYQWLSLSINFTSSHSGLCPVLLACSETAELWVRAKRRSFFHSFLHGSPCFTDVDFSAFAWYLVDYVVLFTWVSDFLRSDLKTVRIPCCCRLRRRVSETIMFLLEQLMSWI